jgi:hypothetical protein
VGIEETVAIALNRFGDAGFSGDGGDRWGALLMLKLAIASLLNYFESIASVI